MANRRAEPICGGNLQELAEPLRMSFARLVRLGIHQKRGVADLKGQHGSRLVAIGHSFATAPTIDLRGSIFMRTVQPHFFSLVDW